jgi:hypothetical protein
MLNPLQVTYTLIYPSCGNYPKTAPSVPPPSSERGGRENLYTVAILNAFNTKP